MRAKFQIQSKGRLQAPCLLLNFSEDVNIPDNIFVSGNLRIDGMILSSFRRPEALVVPVRKGTGHWPKSIVLPWEYIGGYTDFNRIQPSNSVEIPIMANDPVRAERWMIEPIMRTNRTPPVINGPEEKMTRPEHPVLKAIQEKEKAEPVDLMKDVIKAVKEKAVSDTPVFTKLKVAVRQLNDVLAQLPEPPTVVFDGKKIKVSISLE